MNIEEFKLIFPNYKLPYYTHFDDRITLKSALTYVQNPENIIHHAFYPFIEFTKQSYKYRYNAEHKKERQLKIRTLHYATHIDSLIYKYYSNSLVKKYEAFLRTAALSSCVLAYRSDLHKKCNLHFAKEAFAFLRKQQSAYVIVGDFKDFFPSLEHKYLKQRLLDVLGTPSLPNDFYAIFKSLTKYATVKRETLLKLNKLNNDSIGLQCFNHLRKALPSPLTITQAKKLCPDFIQKNQHTYGIPQGTSLSGILANIYMLEFDRQLYNLAQQVHGLYLRYCDDIIIILPDINAVQFKNYYSNIKIAINKIPNLTLEEKKTNIFFYKQGIIKNISNAYHTQQKHCVDRLDYLGFSLSTHGISICDKATSKYYYRMYKKAKTIAKSKAADKKRYSCKNLYLHYSTHHKKIPAAHVRLKYTANFLDYVKRAKAVLKDDEAISLILKKHLHKIRHSLK